MTNEETTTANEASIRVLLAGPDPCTPRVIPPIGEASVSEGAEAYACAVPHISEALALYATLLALMAAYYLPDATLQRLMRFGCLNSEISLRRSVAVGGADALRLLVCVAR
jgi:hypothetical protein